jgi:signal transduction histidine kinase/ActR/RegA family two-component response regulator
LEKFQHVCDSHSKVVPSENLSTEQLYSVIQSNYEKYKLSVPCSLLYLNDSSGSSVLQLKSCTGFNLAENCLVPRAISLDQYGSTTSPIAVTVIETIATKNSIEIAAMQKPFSSIQRLAKVISFPIAPKGPEWVSGVLILGLSQENSHDNDFISLLASQTTELISVAQRFEAANSTLSAQLQLQTINLLRTSRAYAEQQQQRALESERHAKYYLDLSSMLSHEVRNVLQAQNCAVELLKFQLNQRNGLIQKDFSEFTSQDLVALRTGSAQDAESIQSLSCSMQHQSFLTNSVLEGAKLEANKLVLNEFPFEVTQKINEVVQMLRPQALANQSNLLFNNLAQNGPVFINSDPDRLTEILVNLLVNALKFSKQGKVTVELRVAEVLSDFTTLQLEVIDSGLGMTEVELSNLFRPFYQTDIVSNNAASYGGSGLGLFYTKKFIELMGGNITVRSEKGRGSTFSFTIRGKTVENGSEEMKDAIKEASSPASTSKNRNSYSTRARLASEVAGINLRSSTRSNTLSCNSNDSYSSSNEDRKCVLVVDDNAVNRRLLCRLVENEGCKAVMAADGQEAYEIFCRAQPPVDLILLDIQMPVMDGIACAKLIRQFERDRFSATAVPIVCVTGSNDSLSLEGAKAVGVTDVISKPMNRSQLQASLKNYLHHEMNSPRIPLKRVRRL